MLIPKYPMKILYASGVLVFKKTYSNIYFAVMQSNFINLKEAC